MKVKCIDNSVVEHLLTVGKVYDVVDIRAEDALHYVIGTDNGRVYTLKANRFEEVEEEPNANLVNIDEELDKLQEMFNEYNEFVVPSVMELEAHKWFMSKGWEFDIYLTDTIATLSYLSPCDECKETCEQFASYGSCRECERDVVYVRFPQRTIDVVSDGAYIGNAEFVNIVNYLKEIGAETDLSKMKGTREEEVYEI